MFNFQLYLETFQRFLQTNNVTLIASFIIEIKCSCHEPIKSLLLNGVILRRFEMSASDV